MLNGVVMCDQRVDSPTPSAALDPSHSHSSPAAQRDSSFEGNCLSLLLSLTFSTLTRSLHSLIPYPVEFVGLIWFGFSFCSRCRCIFACFDTDPFFVFVSVAHIQIVRFGLGRRFWIGFIEEFLDPHEDLSGGQGGERKTNTVCSREWSDCAAKHLSSPTALYTT